MCFEIAAPKTLESIEKNVYRGVLFNYSPQSTTGPKNPLQIRSAQRKKGCSRNFDLIRVPD